MLFAAAQVVQDVSAGVTGMNASWFHESSGWRHAVEIASRLSPSTPDAFPWSGVTGLRLGIGWDVPVPAEVFLRMELTGRIGDHLEPTCGPELGLSGLLQPSEPG